MWKVRTPENARSTMHLELARMNAHVRKVAACRREVCAELGRNPNPSAELRGRTRRVNIELTLALPLRRAMAAVASNIPAHCFPCRSHLIAMALLLVLAILPAVAGAEDPLYEAAMMQASDPRAAVRLTREVYAAETDVNALGPSGEPAAFRCETIGTAGAALYASAVLGMSTDVSYGGDLPFYFPNSRGQATSTWWESLRIRKARCAGWIAKVLHRQLPADWNQQIDQGAIGYHFAPVDWDALRISGAPCDVPTSDGTGLEARTPEGRSWGVCGDFDVHVGDAWSFAQAFLRAADAVLTTEEMGRVMDRFTLWLQLTVEEDLGKRRRSHDRTVDVLNARRVTP